MLLKTVSLNIIVVQHSIPIDDTMVCIVSSLERCFAFHFFKFSWRSQSQRMKVEGPVKGVSAVLCSSLIIIETRWPSRCLCACILKKEKKRRVWVCVCVCACVCMLVCVYQRVCSSLYRSTLLLKKIVKKQSELRLMRSVFQELKGQSAALSGFFFCCRCCCCC